MKPAIIFFQILATACLLAAAVFIAPEHAATLSRSLNRLTDVPLVYLFSTLSTLSSLATFFILSKAWMKDSLAPRFIAGAKAWAIATFLLTMLQALIFFSAVWDEYRKKREIHRPNPEIGYRATRLSSSFE